MTRLQPSAGARFELPEIPPVEAGGAALQAAIADRPELEGLARQLHETGYAIFNFGYPEAVLEETARFTANAEMRQGRFQDGWHFNTAVKALATYAPVLDTLNVLYGRRAIPFQTLNFKYGTQQATHSDTIHFDSVPARFMCGVWVALEDIHPDGGPLHYYSGSHRLPVYTMDEAAPSGAYRDYERFVAELLLEKGMQRQTAIIRRGEALIWTANLFHGGEVRRSDKLTRLSQVTHYFFEECAYLSPRIVGQTSGKPFVRELFDIERQTYVGSRADLSGGRATLKHRLGLRARRLAAKLGIRLM